MNKLTLKQMEILIKIYIHIIIVTLKEKLKIEIIWLLIKYVKLN